MTLQENLELQIKTYDANYRAGTPLCTDETYDKLVDELREKYPDSELLKNGVIRQEVTRKQRLPIPMYSLDKCKTVEEVKKWLKTNNISNGVLILTPKFDGISLVADERTKNAWTRGDGEFGQESKFHFNKLRGTANDPIESLITFGEAIMSHQNFQMYKDVYANPRNMVAGLFNRDITTMPLQHVDYIRYGCNADLLSKADQLEKLNKLNVVKCPYEIVSVNLLLSGKDNNIESLFNDLYKKWSVNYKIDGLVVDVNDWMLRDSLGREENNNPKYARAIKLQQWTENADVVIVGHTLNVSKQGKIKGTITIPPTEIGGVEVTNATFYNAKFLTDFCLSVGRNITVKRSGDVIPKIVGVEGIVIPQKEDFKNQSEFEKALENAKQLVQDKVGVSEVRKAHRLLDHCPCCGNDLFWDETETELVCKNPDCEEMKISKLVHFFTTLEMEEFGEPSIRRLYEAGYTTSRSILNMSASDFLSIDGFGVSSSSKLLAQFIKLQMVGVPLARLLHASDVFEGRIGEKTVQLILDNIEGEKLPYITTRVTIEELSQISGVGEITAQIFLIGYRRFLNNQQSGVFVSRVQSKKVEVTGNKYAGMKICFSGVRPSKEKEHEILSQGGEIVSGVTGNTTTHLVVKDLGSSSSKTVKAKQLGIKIITMQNL